MSDNASDLASAVAEVHRLRGAMGMIGILLGQGLIEQARTFIDDALSVNPSDGTDGSCDCTGSEWHSEEGSTWVWEYEDREGDEQKS